MEPEELSPQEELAQRIRAKLSRGGQWRLGSLFIVTALIAVTLMIPRWCGIRYDRFLISMYLLLFAGMPTVAWILSAWLPRVSRATRVWVAVVIGVLIVAPTFVMVAVDGNASDCMGLLAVGALFWLPQLAAIAFVRWVVFSSHNRRKLRQESVAPRELDDSSPQT